MAEMAASVCPVGAVGFCIGCEPEKCKISLKDPRCCVVTGQMIN